MLAGPATENDLRFNLAHSGEMALLATARGLDVGVDIERIRPLRDALGLAQRFFAPEETDDLRGLSDLAEREAGFFHCWTRKEAVLKATGDGLHFPLSAFAVTLLPEDSVLVRRDEREGVARRDWTLLSFEPAPGYVAALAHEGPARTYRMLDWSSDAGHSS